MIIGRSIESNKHIAIITPGFPSDESDTTCIPAIQLFVKELKSRGYFITVFALHYPFREDSYFWNGVTVHSLSGKNNPIIKKTVLYNRLQTKLKAVNKQQPIDVLHSFWLNEATYFARKLSQKFTLPLVASAQGQDALSSNNYLKKLQPVQFSIVTMSVFQQKELKKNGIQSSVINWGVDRQLNRPKEYDLIGVGNLIPLKNYQYFVQLCRELKKSNPDFQAVLVGDGKEAETIRKLISKKNLKENIELKSVLPHDETLEYIAKSSVLVHPSTYEGFGMVLIEALANRTHVLASPVGLAHDSKEVNHLTFNLAEDVNTLVELLQAPVPEPIIYRIGNTVDQYISIYMSLG